MKNSSIHLIFFLVLAQFSFSQEKMLGFWKDISSYKAEDTSTFISFRKKKVLYSDLVMINAPFSISFDDSLGNKQRIKYRSNSRPIIGIGFSYKWFAVRLATNLPFHVRNLDKFGETNFFDLGFEFTTKRHFFDLDIHNYWGYTIKNAYEWNDTLSAAEPNLILPSINAMSASVNSWRFLNKNIKIYALRGKTGMYLGEQQSLYIKTTFNLHGVAKSDGIIPSEFHFAANSKLSSDLFAAFDFGFIPGYVYVNRINNWQFSGLFGLGPVIQFKSYSIDGSQRIIAGLAPRYDFRFMAGYNVPKYFVNLVAEFDNKSIRFNDIRFGQTFYTIKFVAGFRFGK